MIDAQAIDKPNTTIKALSIVVMATGDGEYVNSLV